MAGLLAVCALATAGCAPLMVPHAPGKLRASVWPGLPLPAMHAARRRRRCWLQIMLLPTPEAPCLPARPCPPWPQCRRIIWVGPEQRGYATSFHTVAMHAVVSDGESAPRPCLYLQLDSGEEEEEGGVMGLGSGAAAGSEGEDEEGEEEEEEEELPRELRLIPADASEGERLHACRPCLCSCRLRMPGSGHWWGAGVLSARRPGHRAAQHGTGRPST